MRQILLTATLAVAVLPSLAAAEPAAETTLAVGDEAAYRAALVALSADATGPHTIDLTADIELLDGTDPTYTGTQPLTVDGHGFTLDATDASRVLVVDSPTDAAVSITAVTMQWGYALGAGGAVLVRNDSPLAISDSTFANNASATGGGAVEVATTATVERSDFLDNLTDGDGGAIDATAAEGRITVRESTFARNSAASGQGGAISAVGFGTPSAAEGIQRSTFTDNVANEGGALVVGTGVVVSNSTFVGNRAVASGGALLAQGTGLSGLVYSTVTANTAPEGANLTNRGQDLRIFFTAFAEPQGGSNCSLPQGSAEVSDSLADDGSCPGAEQVDDVGLGALGDHGGRTLTRVPVLGSPLIDAIPANYGFPSLLGGCANFQGLDPFDQRGVERPQDGDGRTRTFVYGEPVEVAADCDIGAVEAEAVVAPSTGPVAGAPRFTG